MRDIDIERIKRHGLNLEDFDKHPDETKERIAELEAQNEMLTECILELSEILYN